MSVERQLVPAAGTSINGPIRRTNGGTNKPPTQSIIAAGLEY